ncbi:hypothetical protein ACFJIW_19890 [Tahibacter sp. UC22_41]|uniref:hypothetical protein n=1 Tax=Tahibacter sp. UC22_41 TaxID=3350178 RepID=UPI0036DCA2F1
MPPVKVLSPADHVRQHPERYWGNPSPGVADVNAAIADQLRRDGCREIEIWSKDDWQLVCCEIGWAKTISAQFGSIGRLFEDAVGVPGPTAGGLRAEWFVAVLASAVRVWVDGQPAYSQGVPGPAFDGGLSEFRGRVCIAYCLGD